MMMLMEPIMYLLMALAEKAGIEYRIDDEDDDDDEDENSIFLEKSKNIADTIKEKVNSGKVPSGVLPTNIIEQIENINMPQESLLSRPEEEEVPEIEQSLLSRGQ
jgi:hypothetical protein